MYFKSILSKLPKIIYSIKEEEDKFMPIPYDKFPRGIDGQPMYMTKENASEIGGKEAVDKIEIFENIQRMLEKNQVFLQINL